MNVSQISQKPGIRKHWKHISHSVQLETHAGKNASQMLLWIVTNYVFTRLSAPCCTPVFGSGPLSPGAVEYILIMFVTYKHHTQLLSNPVGV